MVASVILLIEDDPDIVTLLRYNLEAASFIVASAATGAQGQRWLEKRVPDLVILDLMLPEVDGVELCRWIRREPRLRQVPVLMLTAKGHELDRVVGFEVGADDYVTKPFSPRELTLRVKALLKRAQVVPPVEELLHVGPVTVDLAKHEVRCGGREVSLTPIEFALLGVLAQRRGRVQSRDVLLSDVWRYQEVVDTRTVDTHIKRLRAKLGKYGEVIETVHGVGYRCREDGP